MYLRPATVNDTRGIAEIYNYYINHSNIPEDQEVIWDDDVLHLLKVCEEEKLPFIVAVRGNLPPQRDTAGRHESSQKAKLPQFETIIGYSLAEIYNYDLKGRRKGKSRATAGLQLYVHHEYTRKGVGRNLLDRLMHTMSYGYAFKDACPWIDPENNKLYEAGGGGNWHQLLFQLPISKKNDSKYPWVKEFLLNKFFFTEEARLPSVARSSIHHGRAAEWLDVVFFQAEAAHADEFQFEQ